MYLELPIGVGEHWFNKESEEIVIIDHVRLEKSGEIEVDYTYKELNGSGSKYTASFAYFLKNYERTNIAGWFDLRDYGHE